MIGAEVGAHPFGVSAAIAAIAKLSVPFVHHSASAAVAPPDSVQMAAIAADRALRWRHLSEQWRDFFLLAGTAAVTLAGLLFVAVSLHIDTLVHENHQHLLELARSILLSFVMVLTLSLMMLVPNVPLRPSGFYLVVTSLVGTMITLRQLRTPRRGSHPDFSRRAYLFRLLLPIAGFAWIGVTGYGMMVLHIPESLYWSVGGVCMLLGNAVGASWDLLVRTAKIRRRAGESTPIH